MVAYVVTGVLWILFSHNIFFHLMHDPVKINHLLSIEIEEWIPFFVFGTVLFFLIRHNARNAMVAAKKKDLEKVNRELDKFVHIASHDLRAPLRAIGSFASILQNNIREKLDPESADYLKEIILGTQRMSELLDDLLTLSRISKIANPFEAVDIRELIERVKKRLQMDIEQSNALIAIHEPMPVIHCDRIKMTEVFANLINNAIKHSSRIPGDRPKIEVGVTSQQDQHEFFAKDNGIGIDPQRHTQIFDMFKRLHGNDQYEGTGAGLYVVKTIVEAHGGKIWVESQVGQGAAFYFTVPKDLKVENISPIPSVALPVTKSSYICSIYSLGYHTAIWYSPY